jgi:hypothetical protein
MSVALAGDQVRLSCLYNSVLSFYKKISVYTSDLGCLAV